MKQVKAKNGTKESAATILIATDSQTEAAQVRSLLNKEFERVFISSDGEKAVEDFEKHTPDVLVLAFDSLGKSERYYLGLYRLSSKIHLHPHRTIILCDKDEVWRAYELCRKELFDDYILFWPMTFDAPRLPMSVHNALRELVALKGVGPTTSEFASQARRLAGLEHLLDQRTAEGEVRVATTNDAVVQAEMDISGALEDFQSRLAGSRSSGSIDDQALETLEKDLDALRQGVLKQRLRKVADSVGPLKQWADDLRRDCTPHLESAKSLVELAEQVRPTVLVVDDEEFLHGIVAKILEAENYQLVFANGGIEALHVLRKQRPDLILMDVMMPDMDGIETTRRLKAIPELAKVPVIMVTGKSEGQVVIDCLKAGAKGFVVKPFDRNTLIAKVAGLL